MKYFKDFYRLFEIPVTPEQMVEGLSKGWKTPFRDELDRIEIEKHNEQLMEQLDEEEDKIFPYRYGRSAFQERLRKIIEKNNKKKV